MMNNYPERKYLKQYRDLKFFFKEYFVEQQLSPFMEYYRMKTYSPIQVIDLRFQVHLVTLKKLHFLKNMKETLLILIYMLY